MEKLEVNDRVRIDGEWTVEALQPVNQSTDVSHYASLRPADSRRPGCIIVHQDYLTVVSATSKLDSLIQEAESKGYEDIAIPLRYLRELRRS